MGRRFHFVANLGPPPPVVYETETNTFIAAVIAGGDTLTTTEQDALDRFVKDMKGISNPSYSTSNIYSKFLAIWPMMGSTLGSQKWNLIDPRDLDAAYRLSAANTLAVTASSLGTYFIGNVASYCRTFLLESDLPSGDSHFAIFNSTAGIRGYIGGTYIAYGSRPVHYLSTTIYISSSLVKGSINIASAPVSFGVPSSIIGLIMVNRTSSSATNMYVNGVVSGSTSTVAEATNTTELYIGSTNAAVNNPNKVAFTTPFASAGHSLNATESLNYYNAVNALNIALSR